MITITKGEIPLTQTVDSLMNHHIGAVITYLGTVRSFLEGQRSQGLSFEVDDSVMQTALEQIETEALKRFDVREIAIVHRTGSFRVGENILLVAISSAHRGPAFDACRYIIDQIKDHHEQWKNETLGS